MDLMTYALCKGNGGGGSSNKFIVTLTPTAQDYSGTMDKTVEEIKTAYDAGQQIVFRIMMSETNHMDMDCTARWFDDASYPSFNAYILVSEDTTNMLVFVFTNSTNDGAKQTYHTRLYPITPLS